MSLTVGQRVELNIEKPAAGGWMIARHEGQVVLVRGVIPGERVLATVERAEKRMAYASARDVLDPSPDRRTPAADPLCGGALYSHIAYPRQLSIKGDVLRDAFARLGRHPLDQAIDVAGSPETGYRMRARLHIQGERAGFYREGTHQLCEAAATGQLLPGAVETVGQIARSLHERAEGVATSVAITENLDAAQRAAHLELAVGRTIDPELLEEVRSRAGLTGVTARELTTGQLVTAGDASVSDPLHAIAGDGAPSESLRRSAESFFQGNRYLLARLVTAVADSVPESGEILDLYAGVGLFAVSLAALGRLELTAVESDRASGEDLKANARPHDPRIKVRVARVEDYLKSRRGTPPATIVIDPPRTGLSKEALQGIIAQRARRIVYVSCDAPTLARDTRRLLDAGYTMESIRAFDLFPNTSHVETLVTFSAARPL
jgi:23S rRNA (uracil1939-C5)-methyltransferase